MFSRTIRVTFSLSATGTWNVRTLPSRSTKGTIGRLLAGPDLPLLVNGRPLVVLVRTLDFSIGP